MDMCIDISIVTYNSGKWMDQFFNSLMNQSFPLSAINLYFTDNSSTDNTVEILENMKESYWGYWLVMLGILVIDLEQVNLLVLKGMNSFLLHQMFLLLEFILRI